MMTRMHLGQWSRYWTRRSILLWRHHAFRQAPIRIVSRGIAWIGHCLVRKSACVQIGSARAYLELPPFFALGGCATAVYIFREEYEPELRYIESILSRGMTVVDGGANIGLYSVIAAEAVGPSGHVLSFEPSRAAFETLQRSRQHSLTGQERPACTMSMAQLASIRWPRRAHPKNQANSLTW
jgi:hypothetical protein